jgi:alpha-1,2-mannosyltransferase
MVDEHFGINIVEFMASGLIVVANKSGGPQSDIIKSDSEGFLCSTMEEYAETLEKIIAMPEANRREIREKARSVAISRFDSTIFEGQLIKVLASFCTPLNEKKVN